MHNTSQAQNDFDISKFNFSLQMKNVSSISVFLFMLINCFFSNKSLAQVFTLNDGFEGNSQQGTPPPNWFNCNNGYSTVDTQPGVFNNYLSASQGQTYISLVTRQINPPGTVETAWADLIIPFEQDKCYEFKFDLSLTNQLYGTLNGVNYYFNTPCILQIVGFNGGCSSPQNSEILWESDLLNNYSWQTFNVHIVPQTGTFQNIAIRPFFSPPTNFQNSAVLVDNIRLENVVSLACDQGNITIPQGATGINWYYNNQIIDGAHNRQLTPNGIGKYTATFYDNNCLTLGEINFNTMDSCLCPCTHSLNSCTIPNVFTPNGDSKNDVFSITGSNIIFIDLGIYNRWGQQVFKSNTDNSSWTGNCKNGDCSGGVYYYTAQIIYKDGEAQYKKGIVTLIRD